MVIQMPMEMQNQKKPIVTVRDYLKFSDRSSPHFVYSWIFSDTVMADLEIWTGITRLSRDDVAAYFWDRYGSMLINNSEPQYLEKEITFWHLTHKYYFDCLHETTQLDYNPLYNRDLTTEMEGERTPDIVKAKTGTEGSVDSRAQTLEHGHIVDSTDNGSSELSHGHTIGTTHGHTIDTHREMTVETDDEHATDTTYGKTTTTSIDSEVVESTTTYDSDVFDDDKKTVTDTDEVTTLSGKDTESFAGETTQNTEADFHVVHSGTDNTVHGGKDTTTVAGTGNERHSGVDTTRHSGGVTTTHNVSFTESGSESRTQDTHSYGKIGQTSYQTLIEKERNIHDMSIFDIWADRLAERFFIPIWETHYIERFERRY